MSLKNYSDIFVIGDLANFSHQGDRPLPGVAPVAIKEGEYVATAISQRLKGSTVKPFQYFDLGSLAVIGQNQAVVDLGFVKLIWFLGVVNLGLCSYLLFNRVRQ